MILVDANVLMYAAGETHPHKAPSLRLLERIACGEVEASIDAECLQEILHRYRAIERWEDGRRVYDLARLVFSTVVPITAAVTDAARSLMDGTPDLSARDALHAAVCLAEDIPVICSYDRDFDRIHRLQRRTPDDL